MARPAHRRLGVGRTGEGTFAASAKARGALTVTLGTEDDPGITSLVEGDLNSDLPRHLIAVKDLGLDYPFLFCRKLGLAPTDVMPDANSRRRPDRWMSRVVS